MRKEIHQTYQIKSPIEDVWRALTDVEYITQWGAGPAIMSPEEGADFSLWGGSVFGQNIRVENAPVGKKILEQYWLGGDWPEPSRVLFELEEHNGLTILKLKQHNIPEGEFDSLNSGWKEYYLGPIKEYLENR